MQVLPNLKSKPLNMHFARRNNHHKYPLYLPGSDVKHFEIYYLFSSFVRSPRFFRFQKHVNIHVNISPQLPLQRHSSFGTLSSTDKLFCRSPFLLTHKDIYISAKRRSSEPQTSSISLQPPSSSSMQQHLQVYFSI